MIKPQKIGSKIAIIIGFCIISLGIAFFNWHVITREYSNDVNKERNGESDMTFSLNALTLSGKRSSFLVGVDAIGSTSVTPTAGGAAATGTNIGVIQFSDVSMFVLDNAQASVALLYEAALDREPDAGGLVNWINIYNALPASVQAGGVYTSLAETSGNFNGSMSIADGFVNSSEFQQKYGSLTDQQYVTQLYANVLHRAPDQGGMTTWLTALTPTGNTYVDPNGISHAGLGETRAYVLVGFAESNENIADTAASSSTSGTSGWLINTSHGGYADSGSTFAASTVLSQAVSNNYLDTSLISASGLPTAPGTLVGAGAFTDQYDVSTGGQIVTANSAGSTIVLSATINEVTAFASDETINGAPGGGSLIKIGYSNSTPVLNTTVNLHGNGNNVAIYNLHGTDSGIGTTVSGYVPGSDWITTAASTALFTIVGGAVQHLPAAIITGGNGASLQFTAHNYILNVGNVGAGDAASVAAAANAVYTVGYVNGSTVFSGFPAANAGENLTIIGTTSAGNTVEYEWASWSNPGNAGFVPNHSADVTGAHTISASELTLLVTLVGVQASSLTATDFH